MGQGGSATDGAGAGGSARARCQDVASALCDLTVSTSHVSGSPGLAADWLLIGYFFAATFAAALVTVAPAP